MAAIHTAEGWASGGQAVGPVRLSGAELGRAGPVRSGRSRRGQGDQDMPLTWGRSTPAATSRVR